MILNYCNLPGIEALFSTKKFIKNWGFPFNLWFRLIITLHDTLRPGGVREGDWCVRGTGQGGQGGGGGPQATAAAHEE